MTVISPSLSDEKASVDGLADAAPRVAIFMATYNGASFLREQLDSIERQSHARWVLIVSDDGSSDGTLAILEEYRRRWGSERLTIVSGPCKGYVANFLSLTCQQPVQADFYAWSDQDDIWHEDKLLVALNRLQSLPADLPSLYCGRTALILESGEAAGYSPLFSRAPGFANALVQNIGGGNTMVFNASARALLQQAGDLLEVPSHDWWAYLLISAVDGAVHYDSQPMVLYRQHGANLIGSNSSWEARMVRARMLLNGRFVDWNTQNLRALVSMRQHLSSANQITLDRFVVAREKSIMPRVIGISRAGLYRQTLLGNIGLILAALLKRL